MMRDETTTHRVPDNALTASECQPPPTDWTP